MLYTSDGRDVEMSVASTKAFYAQVAAGALLACAITEAAGCGTDGERHTLLAGLRELPGRAAPCPRAAARDRRGGPPAGPVAPVLGGGGERTQHGGRRGDPDQAQRALLQVDRLRRHRGQEAHRPLVGAADPGVRGGAGRVDGRRRGQGGRDLPRPQGGAGGHRHRGRGALPALRRRSSPCPASSPNWRSCSRPWSATCSGTRRRWPSTRLARPLREAREVIELAVGTGAPEPDELLERVARVPHPAGPALLDGLRSGAYDGNLEASTAVALVGRLRDVASDAPLESYQRESGRIATPAGLVDDLTTSLSRAIEELTRPVDAIKHQAKTVTVGISRSDEALLDRELVQAVLAAGAPRERLGYTTLRSLAALDPAVESVVGFTRYAIEGDPADGTATIEIVDRGGVSLSVPSRVDRNPQLQGTKRRVAMERELLVARGRSDGRTVLMVPEVKGSQCTGITLVHAVFADRLAAPVARAVLQGWDRRYDRLVDWVTETEGGFRDDLLAEIPVIDLLTVPVSDLAELWRSQRGGGQEAAS